MLDRCPFCREPILEDTIMERGIEKAELIPCNCYESKKRRELILKRSIEISEKLDIENINEVVKKMFSDKIDGDAKERMASLPFIERIKLMKNTISKVDPDIVKYFYVAGSKIEIPDQYFWQIRCDYPNLSISDFIQHIWLVQSEGADPMSGDVKIIVKNSKVLYGGTRNFIQRGFTAFHWKYAVKKAEATAVYDGYKTDDGVGDYVNPTTMQVSKQLKCTCSVFRKDRSYPMEFTAWLPEWDRGTKWWNDKKHFMLRKCAISNAHKQAFPQVLDFYIDLSTIEENNSAIAE